MALPAFPGVTSQKQLTSGKAPDTSSTVKPAAQPTGQLPLETFLAEWGFRELDPALCEPLHQEHPLVFARRQLIGLAAALRKAGYAK